MQRAIIAVLSISALLLGCGSSTRSSAPPPPVPSVQPATVYTSSDGTGAWHILGNRIWTGNPAELRVAPLSQATATVVYSHTAGVACVNLDEASIFGAPDVLRKGTQFRCGAARFEVIDCDIPENCRNALILALWRTGLAPNYHELPVNYFYNRCRGVQSITFSLDRPLRVGFGETLELRQGLGLLARPDTPECRSDPRASLYQPTATPSSR